MAEESSGESACAQVMTTLWRDETLANLSAPPSPLGRTGPLAADRVGRPRPQAPRLEDFSPAIQEDILRFRAHIEVERLARSFKENLDRLVLDAAQWVCTHGPSAGGLTVLLDEETAREYMRIHAARPLANGQPRSVNSFEWHYRLLEHLWGSAGLARPEVLARLDKLRRSFRRDGDRRGHPDLLNLRRPDPSEAPPLDEVMQLLERREKEIAHARAAGPKRIRLLRRLLTERVLLLTMLLNGFRAASLTSMRVDWFKRHDDGTWRAVVLAKATPKRKGMPPTPRFVVEDQEYAEWPLYPRLMNAYQELFLAHGLDLFEFLRTGRRDAVRWVALTEDVTFGRAAPTGREVAPLWLDWDGRGYLRRHRLESICERLVRKDLKRRRGRMHIFRALALLGQGAKRVENPALVEAVLQMSPSMQLKYATRANRDLARELGTLNLDALTAQTPAMAAASDARPDREDAESGAPSTHGGTSPSEPIRPQPRELACRGSRAVPEPPRHSWRELFEE